MQSERLAEIREDVAQTKLGVCTSEYWADNGAEIAAELLAEIDRLQPPTLGIAVNENVKTAERIG